jgi:hypothetical protein
VGRDASYHPFDFKGEKACSKKSILLKYAPLVIVDVFIRARNFEIAYDLAVLVELADKQRRKRLIDREGQSL